MDDHSEVALNTSVEGQPAIESDPLVARAPDSPIVSEAEALSSPLLPEPVPIAAQQLYALSWRSAKSGVVIELINFAARDEDDLLARFNTRVPREQRVGLPGRSLGKAARRVVEDLNDSLQWIWQPSGISHRDVNKELSVLCAQGLATSQEKR